VAEYRFKIVLHSDTGISSTQVPSSDRVQVRDLVAGRAHCVRLLVLVLGKKKVC